jgi:protein-disulfide isomerase
MLALGPAAIALALLLTAQTAAAQKPAQTEYHSKEFEEALRSYITNHPEVVMEAIQLFQTRQQAAKQQAAKDAVRAHQSDLLADPLGSPANAQKDVVAVVEFFDYLCGYCRKMQSTVEKLANSPGIRIVYKELPILGPESLYASKAALAAAKQGYYEKFHQALMNSSAPITAETVDKLAAGLGMDLNQLKKDMESREVIASISQNSALAESLGIEGTPAFVVGKEVAPGAVSEQALQSLIDSERNKAKSVAAVAGAGSL